MLFFSFLFFFLGFIADTLQNSKTLFLVCIPILKVDGRLLWVNNEMCYSTCTCNCLAQASAVAVFPLGRETCLPRLQLQLERSFRSTTSKRVEGGRRTYHHHHGKKWGDANSTFFEKEVKKKELRERSIYYACTFSHVLWLYILGLVSFYAQYIYWL